MNTVVNAAASVNKALMENCSICTMYCDRQVKFEDIIQQQYDINNIFHPVNPNSHTNGGVNGSCNGNNNDDNPMTPNDAQINQYKEFLFDEASVIESVASRDATED